METENSTSLHDALNEATEHKEPIAQNKSFEWNFDEAVIEEEIKTDPKPIEQQSQPETKQPTPPAPPEKKVTDKAKRASARTAVNMIDFVQKGLFTPILSYKYKRKFTDDEINALENKNLVDAKKDELEAEDLQLRNKWDRLMKRCNKKLDAAEFTDEEKTDLEEAFFAYFDFKEKTLSPEWFVGLALVNTIGKRAIDTFTD